MLKVRLQNSLIQVRECFAFPENRFCYLKSKVGDTLLPWMRTKKMMMNKPMKKDDGLTNIFPYVRTQTLTLYINTDVLQYASVCIYMHTITNDNYVSFCIFIEGTKSHWCRIILHHYIYIYIYTQTLMYN